MTKKGENDGKKGVIYIKHHLMQQKRRSSQNKPTMTQHFLRISAEDATQLGFQFLFFQDIKLMITCKSENIAKKVCFFAKIKLTNMNKARLSEGYSQT